MKQLNILAIVVALLGVALPATLASAQNGGINLRSSEYRVWNNLPRTGEPARIPWVGYWWAYTDNGIASRYGSGDSPAEKYDHALGRDDQLNMDALNERIDALRSRVHPLSEERRESVQKLNRAIARGENYRDCSEFESDGDCISNAETTCACPWNRYQELGNLITEAERDLPEVNIDTATEFEHMNHGHGVAGVQGWWGHCNAWAAAAILEPEPVHSAEIDGTTWNVGDVKALLTESYMTMNSAFYGSRVGENQSSLSGDPARRIRELVGEGKSDNEIQSAIGEAFEDASSTEVTAYLEWFRAWNDVTPADFHILFTVYLGQLHRSFVIDRFTGDEVWNQPVSGFESRVVRELEKTEDDLYPVLIEATFEWATDGVRPDQTNESVGSSGFHDRTVTYTLYLDKPASDQTARIVGPGKWEHAASPGDHAHPDFIWVPLSDAPARPKQDGSYYENRFVDLAWIQTNLMPHVIATPEPGPGPNPDDRELSASSAPGTAIEDNAEIADTLDIMGEGTIAGVQVDVDIAHTYVGDLEVVLQHGDREARLHNRTGGGQNDLVKTFTVTDFDGLEAIGAWTLVIRDKAGGDTGSLRSWRVSITVGGGGDGGGGTDPGGDAETHTYTAAGTPAAIPDNDEAGVSVTFEVPDTFSISSGELELNIPHTYIGDLRVVLEHGGVEQVLHDREGGSAENINRSYSLSRFDGKAAAGLWTLRVSDHAGRDTGSIESASLQLVGTTTSGE